jgi:hypothetical protein
MHSGIEARSCPTMRGRTASRRVEEEGSLSACGHGAMGDRARGGGMAPSRGFSLPQQEEEGADQSSDCSRGRMRR